MNYNVDVLINGNKVKKYSHQRKTFVEAKKNSKYRIRLENNSPTRKLFVISVDGVNVISGKSAKKNDKIGYVIDGNSTDVIKGYRLNNDFVAEFKFDDKEKSYASEVGEKGNCGVIGVKVYTEIHNPPIYTIIRDYTKNIPYKPYDSYPWPSKPYPYEVWYSCDSNSSAITNFETESKRHHKNDENRCFSSLGTSWGNKQQSKVQNTNFETSYCDETILLYYASRKDLMDLGVDLNPKGKITMPSAFGESDFCSPPKNWKG